MKRVFSIFLVLVFAGQVAADGFITRENKATGKKYVAPLNGKAGNPNSAKQPKKKAECENWSGYCRYCDDPKSTATRCKEKCCPNAGEALGSLKENQERQKRMAKETAEKQAAAKGKGAAK